MKTAAPLLACCLGLLLVACAPASEHMRDIAAGRDGQDRMTLGTVQREIRIGMSGAEVAGVLGAPNIVTTDERRRETWVYDRIATEHAYSASAGGVNALFLAGVGGRTGASQTSQRTLTVVVRFDEVSRVRDFSYRSSSF
jgi:hypothetical protein